MKPSNLFIILLRLLGCLTLIAGSVRAAESEDETPVQLKQGIEGRHPEDYYKLAAKLFQDVSTKQEAVSWFYVGQLRYRYYLADTPSLEAESTPSLASMSTTNPIGDPIGSFLVIMTTPLWS